jgi:hypothetical protein
MPVRGGRDIKVVDDGNDTLTESCEGAVSFMVIEIRVGSWQELPVVVVLERMDRIVRDKMRSGRRGEGSVPRSRDILFLSMEKEGWMGIDQLRQTVGVPRSDIRVGRPGMILSFGGARGSSL